MIVPAGHIICLRVSKGPAHCFFAMSGAFFTGEFGAGLTPLEGPRQGRSMWFKGDPPNKEGWAGPEGSTERPLDGGRAAARPRRDKLMLRGWVLCFHGIPDRPSEHLQGPLYALMCAFIFFIAQS